MAVSGSTLICKDQFCVRLYDVSDRDGGLEFTFRAEASLRSEEGESQQPEVALQINSFVGCPFRKDLVYALSTKSSIWQICAVTGRSSCLLKYPV